MKARGFTLIEVMVALFVIALGVGALLSTLVSSADNIGYQREKAFAQWIALNRISAMRLAATRPEQGITRDTVEYAGAMWQWEQEVADAGLAGLLRVDVRVAPLREGREASVTGSDERLSSVGRAVGFIGTSVARPSGLTPDWSPGAIGGDGERGGDGEDEGDRRGGPGGPAPDDMEAGAPPPDIEP